VKSRQEQKVEEGVKALLGDGEVVLAAVVARPRGWTQAGAGSRRSGQAAAGARPRRGRAGGDPPGSPMALVVTDRRLLTLQIGSPIGLGIGGEVKELLSAVPIGDVDSIRVKRLLLGKTITRRPVQARGERAGRSETACRRPRPRQGGGMSRSIVAPLVAATPGLVLAGCGGGGVGGGSSSLALGEEAVVEHTEIGASGAAPKTTLGITVLRVRQGTEQGFEQGGFQLDPDEKSTTLYYVDVRYENQGTQAIKRQLNVGLEDDDGSVITATTIISLGGPPFEKCARISDGELAPGASYESCTLFLVPEGKEPSKVSFLPYDPGTETDFVYWDVG